MQIVDRKDIEKRILFYWSKMYASSIKSGSDYEELEKSIVILITDYNLDNLNEITNFISKWNIREEKNPHIVLTNVLEIYIIELDKVSKVALNEEDNLTSWLNFINNPKEISSMENKEIKKAKKVLEEISQDARERRLTELREKYIMDQKAIYGRGYEIGLRDRLVEIAKKMKSEGIEVQVISKITELTEEEIKKL